MAALGADLALFVIGLSFASQVTILPAFAVELGAPNVVIGAIPAIMTVGWFLPALFVAGHTETLARRLPFVLRWTVWERVPFLFLAFIAFVIAGRAPGLALALMLASLLLIASVGGVLMPAWMDLVGRAIPTDIRGRFFAVTTAASSLGGLAGSFATAWILGAVASPAGFGICFLIAAAFTGLSYIALAIVREPPTIAPAPRTSLRAYLGRMPDLLRRDRNFSWYLISRAFGLIGGMGAAFFTVFALSAHGASTRDVGFFTAVFFAGQILGTLGLGWLADHAGHRLSILAGAGALFLANVVALAAPNVYWFSLVFALNGLMQAAVHVSNQTILLEFAPTTEERPTYVGLGNTIAAPFAFAAPIVAGVIADTAGFSVVFLVSGVTGLACVLLMLARVREPRHATA